ncbi:MAG TPA: hypothetical protein PK413_02350, partial [Thermoanaerobaculia bacterium]|nr:hypothetical protein [Thermoanaerobaculia bacterium]
MIPTLRCELLLLAIAKQQEFSSPSDLADLATAEFARGPLPRRQSEEQHVVLATVKGELLGAPSQPLRERAQFRLDRQAMKPRTYSAFFREPSEIDREAIR